MDPTSKKERHCDITARTLLSVILSFPVVEVDILALLQYLALVNSYMYYLALLYYPMSGTTISPG